MKPKKVITRSKFNYVDFLSSFHGLVHAAENGSAEAKGFLTTMYHSFKITERVLALPYSPVSRRVITQSELRAAIVENRAYKASNLPASVIKRNRVRNARFEAGWAVEPGRFGMEMNGPDCFSIIDHTQPRAARADTPTAAQLQAWFDLPSEPLQSP